MGGPAGPGGDGAGIARAHSTAPGIAGAEIVGAGNLWGVGCNGVVSRAGVTGTGVFGAEIVSEVCGRGIQVWQ